MSASQEKKKRRELRADGEESKKIRRSSTARAKKRRSIITAVVAIVVVLAILVLVVFNSTLFYTRATAVRVGEHNYSADQFNYFYQNAYMTEYQRIYDTFGSYVTMFLNPSVPLSEQQSFEDSELTWDEYFEKQALEDLQRMAMLGDAARAEGYTLSTEELALVDSTISSAKSTASEAGKNFRSYLAELYGKGFNEKMYRELLTEQSLAASYSQAILDRAAAGYTDEMLLAKYDAVSDKYDLFTYCYYFVDGQADDEAGIDADTAKNRAFAAAQAIAAARTEEVFSDLVQQYCPEDEQATYADPEAVLRKNVPASSLSSSYSDWLISAERSYGDTTYIESDTGYYVLLFVGRNHNDYPRRSFRHILVQVNTEDGADEGTEVLNAQATANEIYQLWQEDPTEEHFAELANERSQDGGSNTNGGLYENVALGQMVTEVENWLFTEGRQSGDHGIVFVKSSGYTGYHILYFVGENDTNYNLELAKGEQQTDDFNAWVDSRKDAYPISKAFAFRFAKG